MKYIMLSYGTQADWDAGAEFSAMTRQVVAPYHARLFGP